MKKSLNKNEKAAFFSTMSKLLRGVQGEKKAENFLCIIKSWAFPDWFQQPSLLNRAENTKADGIESRSLMGDMSWMSGAGPTPSQISIHLSVPPAPGEKQPHMGHSLKSWTVHPCVSLPAQNIL